MIRRPSWSMYRWRAVDGQASWSNSTGRLCTRSASLARDRGRTPELPDEAFRDLLAEGARAAHRPEDRLAVRVRHRDWPVDSAQRNRRDALNRKAGASAIPATAANATAPNTARADGFVVSLQRVYFGFALSRNDLETGQRSTIAPGAAGFFTRPTHRLLVDGEIFGPIVFCFSAFPAVCWLFRRNAGLLVAPAPLPPLPAASATGRFEAQEGRRLGATQVARYTPEPKRYD